MLIGENGKITIDEIATKSDQKKIRETIEILENVKKTLNGVIQSSAEYKGMIPSSIQNKARILLKNVEQAQSELSYSDKRIEVIVRNYKELDARIKALIEADNNSLGGNDGGKN